MPAPKPIALVVLLENVGHIAGVRLPQWLMDVLDYVTEEYAKFLLRLLGAYRNYDLVVILEDERVTGGEFASTLIGMSRTHRLDLLLLVHGQDRSLVGYRGKAHVDGAVFEPLLANYRADPTLLDLRIVYGLNCYGASLAPIWLALGAQAVNGAVGVNWLPEPNLSGFLRRWMAGVPFSRSVVESHHRALAVGQRLWPKQPDGTDHPRIAGSRQIIYGRRDVSIHSVS